MSSPAPAKVKFPDDGDGTKGQELGFLGEWVVKLCTFSVHEYRNGTETVSQRMDAKGNL